jgi:hypothetical protein
MGTALSVEGQSSLRQRVRTASVVVEPFWAAEEKRRAEGDAEYLAASRDKISRSMSLGLPVWVYRTTYIEVDAQIGPLNDPAGLDIRQLSDTGYAGWEPFAVIPRTYSSTQGYLATSRLTWRDWGGQQTSHQVGLSANVIGVYVLQRLRVTPESLDAMGEEINAAILENAPH